MPTEAENIQFLYLVLTHDGTPNVDWDEVGTALDLSRGAVSKRWSRLKQSMEKGEAPSGTTYQFLWLCVKHNSRDKAMNWTEIAEKCNTTSGAASKRYSRMKVAFEQGVAPPGTASTNNALAKTKSTPKKKKVDVSSDGNVKASPNLAPKRKRAPPKKKSPAVEEQKFKLENEDDSSNSIEEEPKPKRAKATRIKATPKAKTNQKANSKAKLAVKKQNVSPTPTTEATTLIKSDMDEDAFYDAQEEAGELFQNDQDFAADRLHEWLHMAA